MSFVTNLLDKRKCPICKKTFYCDTAEWVYRTKINGRVKYYCKWTCLLKAKEEEKAKREKAKEARKA